MFIASAPDIDEQCSEPQARTENAITMRWSFAEVIAAPIGFLPFIIMPSAVSAASIPNETRRVTVSCRRSDSLSLNLAAPFITVLPAAKAAVTAMMGTRSGIWDAFTTVPLSFERLTVIPWSLSSISAPKPFSISTIALSP